MKSYHFVMLLGILVLGYFLGVKFPSVGASLGL